MKVTREINKKGIFLLFLSLFFLSACRKECLDSDEYVTYVTNPDNGLIKKEQFGDMTVEVFYQPLDYVFLKERSAGIKGTENYSTWKKQKDRYDFYIIRLTNNKSKEIAEYKSEGFNGYTNKLDYLVSGFQNDINMVSGKDTIPCALMHYERNFGLSANNNFNILFKKDESQNDRLMIIDLSVFDLGKVKFRFKKEELDNIPKLII